MKDFNINQFLSNTKKATSELLVAKESQIIQTLNLLKENLNSNRKKIIQENSKDLANMDSNNPMRDRLLLTDERIDGLIQSIEDVIGLKDPTDQELVSQKLENGLNLTKITVPLGVVGVIYESRPNVTIDVAILCLRTRNGVILRGGTDAYYTNSCLVELIQNALVAANFNASLVQLLPPDRSLFPEFLNAKKYIDILIPRGSDSLIQRVRNEASIPVIETGAGVCHTYVTDSADIEMALNIVQNAKVSRPSVCNALDTILLDRNIAQDFLSRIEDKFKDYQVKIYADEASFSILEYAQYPFLHHADLGSFGKEYLDFACSIKIVDSFEEALEHISEYSSKHSEAIITEDESKAEEFLKRVDAAAVYWNASTRFTDGGVFQLGAEIGISTQKLHARGPFALEKLVTEKWVLRGDGQVRW
ncbi:MAG: Glutamate-5-semialdehyde dehydrogenase [Bacteroidota bacterium]|jgi:glutamate-5-semialdehyde dehydrogenase